MNYRQRIVEEAAIMFRTYGIRAVTMDTLASSLGISKRTIYEVFKDKDELLKGVLQWMHEKQREIMVRIFNESENVIDAVFKMLDTMSDHFSKMSPAFIMDLKRFKKDILVNIKEINEMPYYQANTEILERGIREGLFREDIDLNITNKCLFEVARLTNDRELFPPDDFMSRDVVRNFYINYLRGISTPKGLELINRYEKARL
ncbi:MAG: TetR/AcrR family transcriptional regulator [Bacteroidales bacterium]|nr:TetR/AcrR family transcriptional regulator [Bacteroidales bacterium]